MHPVVLLLVLLLLLGTTAPAAAAPRRAGVEVLWDTYGVPHLYADDYDSLAYGYGYAQARDHVSTLLKFVGVARGRAAEYWGEQWRSLDLRTLSFRIPDYTTQLYAAQDPEAVAAFEAYAAGFTQYVNENPGDVYDPALLQVLPVTGQDFFGHGMRTYWEFAFYQGYSIDLAGAEADDKDPSSFRMRFQRDGVHYAAFSDWEGDDRRQFKKFEKALGSNAWAINGPKAAGSAKLAMNPHLPYMFFYRWYEAHFVVASEDYDFYGTGFLGLPNLQIGFNEFLGWTHTVNRGQPWTIYELELINDNQYLFDGQLRTLAERRFTFKVKQADGTYIEETLVVESSIHGDITRRSGNRALAVRLAGTDRPNPVYEWTLMSRARSMDELKDVMRMLQIAMFTTVAASRDGDIMAVFNAFVPRRSSGDWDFWSRPVPGNSSQYLWTEIHSWDELPRVDNPASGYVQNCNEPPWSHTMPLYERGANPDEFPPYMSAAPSMSFRPQASVRLLESRTNFTYEQFIEIKHSTLKEYANHAVDDLVAAITEHGAGEPDLQQAANILRAWDRTYDAVSPGSVLFHTWTENVPEPVFVNAWSDEDPLGTPNTLDNPVAAVEAMRESIRSLRLRSLPLDASWGDTHRFPDGRRPNLSYPGHGDSDTFRNIWWLGDNVVGPFGGDSFVGIVEFNADGPRAKTLIGYGNATPFSRGGDVFMHVNDQWDMFSRKELRDAFLTRSEIEANLEERFQLEYSR